MDHRIYQVTGGLHVLVEGYLSDRHWLTKYPIVEHVQPDLILQLIDEFPTTGAIRYIELDKTGYNDQGYITLISDVPPKKCLIPLEALGQRSKIICEKGVTNIPYLELSIYFEALLKNILPLHASTFHFDNRTWVASGYPQGGKTSLLLALMMHGAKFISDDWVYVHPDRVVEGVSLPMTLRSWQLEQLPTIKQKVRSGGSKLTLLKTLRSAAGMIQHMPLVSSKGRRFLQKGSDKLSDLMNVSIDPEKIFSHSIATTAHQVDGVLLSFSHSIDEIIVEPVAPELGIEQLYHMQLHEWQPLLDAYVAYQAAMPDRRNQHIENLQHRLKSSIQERFGHLPFFKVYHPHPVQLYELFNVFQSTANRKE